jgi:hypothetical protein
MMFLYEVTGVLTPKSKRLPDPSLTINVIASSSKEASIAASKVFKGEWPDFDFAVSGAYLKLDIHALGF